MNLIKIKHYKLLLLIKYCSTLLSAVSSQQNSPTADQPQNKDHFSHIFQFPKIKERKKHLIKKYTTKIKLKYIISVFVSDMVNNIRESLGYLAREVVEFTSLMKLSHHAIKTF